MALSNEQYQAIMREYEDRRKANRDLLEARKKEIYDRIPEFQDLDDSVSSIVSKLLSRLNSDPSAPSQPELPKINPFRAINERRAQLLQSNGYPTDYLEPIYTCPDCKDTGYRSIEDGTQIKCQCFRNREIDFLYQQSNLQGVLETDRFSNLSYEYCEKPEDLEHLRGAVKISLDFVKNFDQSAENILFCGTVGTGKSFLSGCIANELLQKSRSVVYFSAIGLFETLARYSFGTFEKESLYNFCKDLYNYDLVIVDDLGTEVTNSFVQSELFSLLNERAMRGKSTIISTNLNLGELRDRYSERVFSRITRNFTICMLTGRDVRLCQKLKSMPQNN